MDWHRYFIYDPERSVLIWRSRPRSDFKSNRAHAAWNARFSGKMAGHIQPNGNGYLVRLDDVMYKGYRIIYEMHHGPIPDGMKIDHWDRDRSNDSLDNLRLATYKQNNANRKGSINSKTGLKGVTHYKVPGKFRATIGDGNGGQIWLGIFDTKGMAALAYAKASLRYHGKFSSFYVKSAT